MVGTRVAAGVLVAALAAAGCSSGGAGTGSDSSGGDSGGGLSGVGDAELASLGLGSASGEVGAGVTVIGEGRVTGQPDTLTATVGVRVVEDSVDQAIATANERAQAVIDAVIDAGVDEQDTQTARFSVRPRYGNQSGNQAPEITGYAVDNLLTVEVRDLDAAGGVLEAAVDAGGDAAQVQQVSFSLEDNQELLEAAREAAVADARSKAEQYAALSDRELGELVGLREQSGARPQAVSFDADAAAGAESAGAPPLQQGTQEVSVRVEAVWSFG